MKLTGKTKAQIEPKKPNGAALMGIANIPAPIVVPATIKVAPIFRFIS